MTPRIGKYVVAQKTFDRMQYLGPWEDSGDHCHDTRLWKDELRDADFFPGLNDARSAARLFGGNATTVSSVEVGLIVPALSTSS